MLVDQTGVACHTGEPTCFHQPLTDGAPPAPFAALADLERTIADRAEEGAAGVVVHGPPAGEGHRLGLQEGGGGGHRVVLAAKGAERDQVIRESADLLYHLTVLWHASGGRAGRGCASWPRGADDAPPARRAGPRRSRLDVSPGVEAVRAMEGLHGQVPLAYIADCARRRSARS